MGIEKIETRNCRQCFDKSSRAPGAPGVTRTKRGRKCNHAHLLKQIVVTSFIEGLNNATLRWELRKLKPQTANDALTKALELQAYLELEGPNAAGNASVSSAGVNQMTNQFLQEITTTWTNLGDHLEETLITSRNVVTEDREKILVTESQTGTTPWKGEHEITHVRE